MNRKRRFVADVVETIISKIQVCRQDCLGELSVRYSIIGLAFFCSLVSEQLPSLGGTPVRKVPCIGGQRQDTMNPRNNIREHFDMHYILQARAGDGKS